MDNPTNLQDGATPVSDIKLGHISNARDASKQRPKVEFCFVATTPERSYYFVADDQADLEEWVRSLNGASRIMVKIPDKKSSSGSQPEETQGDKSQNGNGDDDKQSTISYKTEIVGGVVIRTPVEIPFKWPFYLPWRFLVEIRKWRDGQTALPKKQLRYYPPTNGALTISTAPEDSSSSEDESSQNRSKSWPRSPSPTPPVTRTLNFAHSQAIMSGFCVKQGGVRKNWKRRFFVLNDDGFSYYKGEMDKLPLRTILKKDIASCKVSDIPLSTQRDNLFEVTTATRTFYVQADSPEEMKEWVTKIRTLVGAGGHRSSLPPDQSTTGHRSSSLFKKEEGSNKVRSEQNRRASSPRSSSGPNRLSSKQGSHSKQGSQRHQGNGASNQKKGKDEVKGQENAPMVTHL
ncbi:pleckstrin homology domain-containing family A member 1-like [Amphiura filiformis]|uniref:pleckstrin homology domain-containing family A member 1-like n=1 Tax=Amphiura filiformis TaxID=82378 RepID=UPI003B20F305